jgi:TRAP-type mannitol/chloroaromatic compound transport system substrate-binding protein
MKRRYAAALAAGLSVLAALGLSSGAAQAQTKVLKMQATWPASLTLYDNFTYFAERVSKLSAGTLKIEAMPAGQVVPAFEVLDATHKKVLDGAHAWAGYWTGKNKTAILFTGGPVEDMKGMKCRQTGIAGEVWQALGFTVVNMPGGEIIPAAQRGVIDCAEWVGGVEDLRLGFHNVWKYHYTPGVHENVTVGELLINGDVWKELTPQHQEIVKSAANEAFLIWWAKWQLQNADALTELQEKHGVQILRTPPEILLAFIKKWDEIAAAEGAKNPFFKRVHDSQRAYASKVVPYKRFYFPPYSFMANYYFPPKN